VGMRKSKAKIRKWRAENSKETQLNQKSLLWKVKNIDT
jgi:hypothetical protein